MGSQIRNTEARIKLLCSLGLDGQAILPTLLKELRASLPFGSALFAYAQSNKISSIYAEHPEIVGALPDYESIWLAEEAKVMPVISETMRTQGPRLLEQKIKVSQKQYYASSIYNELLLPAGVHHMQCGALRVAGETVGVLSLYRDKKEKNFGKDQLSIWRRLELFMAYGLSNKKSSDISNITASDDALLIADSTGKVQFMSPNLGQMMTACQVSTQQLDHLLIKLKHRLDHIRKGIDQTAPPICHHHTAVGYLEIRAYWLDPNTPGDSLIGFSVHHSQPVELKLFESISKFNLPKRTAEICLHLLMGDTQECIAKKLGLSTHTVIHYRRQIYDKLMVCSREELKQKVMHQLKK